MTKNPQPSRLDVVTAQLKAAVAALDESRQHFARIESFLTGDAEETCDLLAIAYAAIDAQQAGAAWAAALVEVTQ